MRGLLREFGIAIPQGARHVLPSVRAKIDDPTAAVPSPLRPPLAVACDDIYDFERRAQALEKQLQLMASDMPLVERLMTIPGIGPISATALVAAAGDGKQFRKGRDFAAWLGLVPRQYSTGGKNTLLGISKRGNPYVRRLLIHGARSCVMHLDRTKSRLGAWIETLMARMHANKVTVALANKIARTAWAILTTPGATYTRRDPRFAL